MKYGFGSFCDIHTDFCIVVDVWQITKRSTWFYVITVCLADNKASWHKPPKSSRHENKRILDSWMMKRKKGPKCHILYEKFSFEAQPFRQHIQVWSQKVFLYIIDDTKPWSFHFDSYLVCITNSLARAKFEFSTVWFILFPFDNIKNFSTHIFKTGTPTKLYQFARNFEAD